MWKNIGIYLLWLLPLLFFSSATIYFIAVNLMEYQGEVSIWQVMTIKYLAKQFNFDGYRWWIKFVVFFFMALGWILDLIYLKFSVKEKLKSIRNNKAIASNDNLANILAKSIDKIQKNK